jgi:hypothetical protein
MWHESGKGEVHTGFWWRKLRERDHLKDVGVDWRIILKWILEKWDGEARTGSVWLGMGAGAGIL